MGLTPDEIRDANLVRENFQRSASSRRGHLNAGRARHGTDLMAASEVELVGDFSARIRQGREQKGWDQRTLALRMKERINEVKRAESGHRPADKVLTKFERSLDIVLMEAIDGGHERNVKRSTPRTLNLGDILDAAKRDKD
jgi:ribosome-binding protein aMBF1 (putative translation factor)